MLPQDDDADLLPAPPSLPSPPPPPPPPPPPVEVPVAWLLENASPTIQFRTMRAFIDFNGVPAKIDALTLTREAGRLAVAQNADGMWSRSILEIPAHGARNPAASVGTASAVHRLLELGWDRESPPLFGARRPLFRLLAEDHDPAFLYELAPNGKEVDVVHWSRGVLRGAAAAALAHAGYERDPRLRGAATRLVERVDDFISSPLADDPWVKVSGTPVLSPDAAPPSMHFLMMLAFMPEFRNERDDFIDRLMSYLSRPVPKHVSAQLVGTRVLKNRFLLLGDPIPSRQAADADVPHALLWLELAARLRILERHEGWKRHFERFLDDRGRDFVWRPSKSQTVLTSHDVAWPFADLQGKGAEGISADATFRLGLIAKTVGRPIEFA